MSDFPAYRIATAQLSFAEKLGQLFMPAAFVNDTEAAHSELEALIRDYHIGAICFFHSRASAAANFEGPKKVRFNASSKEVLKKLIRRFRKAASYPLLVAIDAEWGMAMRLENSTAYPYALTLGALSDSDPLLYQTGLRMAEDCRELGIDWNLAPVVDINTNPENPVIGYRSFGARPESVALKALQVHRGLMDGGVLSCLKHFPGHGDTATDSHLSLPLIQKGVATLEQEELIPYKKLIPEGVPAIMTGHLAVPSLDPSGNPASLSPELIEKLLRQKLGFRGVVITDALNMHAVSKLYSEPGMLELRALEAGNDLLCFTEDIPQAITQIKKRLSAESVEDHFKRVWNLKKVHFDTQKTVISPALTPDELLAKLARQCLSPVPIKGKNPKTTGEGPFYLVVAGKALPVFEKAIQGPELQEQFFLPADAGTNPFEWPPPGSKVLLALNPGSYKPKENFGFSDFAFKTLEEILEKYEVLLYHFGNPYLLEKIRVSQTSALVLAYQDLQAFQEQAARHFRGQAPLNGKLAVPLHLK